MQLLNDEEGGFTGLVIAIMKKAIQDIEHGTNYDKNDAIQFIRSDWCYALTGFDKSLREKIIKDALKERNRK